ncbi:MAG: YARHG domain-containing protein [Marinibacterium sp.]|nr:YARHG domain-containing protein [Marinibacterium sp.]
MADDEISSAPQGAPFYQLLEVFKGNLLAACTIGCMVCGSCRPPLLARPNAIRRFQRNTIFFAEGYCCNSARGKASFSNTNCIPGMSASQVPLTAAERNMVDTIRAQEKATGCN